MSETEAVANAVARPDVIERKAVVRMLTFRAARAWWHRENLPWWAWYRRAKHSWTMTSDIITAAGIERGEHLSEQSQWLNDIRGGLKILDGIEVAIRRQAPRAQNPVESAS